MQLKDLLKPLDSLTDEELFERIRQIRSRRMIERPAAAARVARAAKKDERKATTEIDNLLNKLSPEELAKLMAKLGEGK